VIRIVSFFLLLAAAAAAQTTPFGIVVNYRGNTFEIAENGNFTMNGEGMGVASTATVRVINRGTAPADLAAVQLTGFSDFTLGNLPDLPYPVPAGGSITLSVTHTPTVGTRTTGLIGLAFGFGNVTRSFGINLAGTSPDLVYSYTPQGGNATNIVTGDAIRFPSTPIDATTSAAVVVTNRGTASGTVTSISVSGENFQGVGIPLPNTAVEAGRDLRFTVTYTAKSLDLAQGTLRVVTPERQNTFRLEGPGQGPNLAYEVITGSTARPIRPGESFVVPPIAINEKSSVFFRIRNTGNFEGRIAAITLSGTGYSLSETPILPLTLAANGSVVFTVNFSPTTPGVSAGRLRVGNDDFTVSSTGLGATLSYSYTTAGASTSVSPNGSVNLPSVAVGSTTSTVFRVQNTGTTATTVNAISVTSTTVFTLGQLPALPHTLQPDAFVEFHIVFAPTVQGAATTTLRVDSQTFTVNAAGNPPPALSAIRFDGASGAQEPLSQPSVGVLLASAYPLPLTGTLTLAFNSEVFANDPSVQFGPGGRTVNFTIPAGTTRAIFSNNASSIRIQTGSVAGSIVLTPSVSTEGGINLTPSAPPTQTLTVASAAPRIASFQLAAKAPNSLTLLISGYSTARSVTSIELQFTPRPGENVSTTRLSIPVEPAFVSWYQNTQSAQFGSLFSVTIPLGLQGDVNASGESPSDTIQSVSAVLSNRLGNSPPAALTLRQ
jgi:hypothetical protein